MAQWVKNLTAAAQFVGSIPGQTQLVKGAAIKLKKKKTESS